MQITPNNKRNAKIVLGAISKAMVDHYADGDRDLFLIASMLEGINFSINEDKIDELSELIANWVKLNSPFVPKKHQGAGIQ